MNNTAQATKPRIPSFRIVKGCDITETPEFKRYRLAVATVKLFTEEFPEEAVKIVRDAVPDAIRIKCFQ